jgi:hypothetical protein
MLVREYQSALDCWPARESPRCGIAYISALRGDNGRSKCPPGSRSSSRKFLSRCQSLVLVDESYEVSSAEDGTVLLEVKRQVVARLTLAHVIAQEVTRRVWAQRRQMLYHSTNWLTVSPCFTVHDSTMCVKHVASDSEEMATPQGRLRENPWRAPRPR